MGSVAILAQGSSTHFCFNLFGLQCVCLGLYRVGGQMAAKRAVNAAEDARSPQDARIPRDKNGVLEVPQGLLDAISKGQCVAFVGAGFSGAARLPGWAKLLEGILRSGLEAGKIPESKKNDIQALIDEATSTAFDTAA